MGLQALPDAAMVSTMSFDQATSRLARFLRTDEEDAQARLLDFRGWDTSDGAHQ